MKKVVKMPIKFLKRKVPFVVWFQQKTTQKELINMKTTNNFLHNLQVKLWQKTEKVAKDLSIKEKKFTRDMIQGIIKSRSCILRQIAQSQKEDISLEDTCKRYRRHLSKPEISSTLSENHLRQHCRKINQDSLIIFDPSDIRKNYAQKMEGLSVVHDGSTGKSCKGYNIRSEERRV